MKYRIQIRDLWASNFGAVAASYALPEAKPLEEDTPLSDTVDSLRILFAPDCWPVVFFLLRGPKKFAALLAADLAESSQTLADVLDKLIEAGLLVQDKYGYRLQENDGLLLAGMIKAFCLASSRCGAGLVEKRGVS